MFDLERQSPLHTCFLWFSYFLTYEKYIICVMIPEFGWLSDQGQGKKFIKLSFSHKHSVNCQTLHDDTTHSVDLFKIPFHIFCDLEHISRLQQHQTVWGENYCISYKWCLHGSFDFLSVLHWLQRAPPAIHYVAYFSFEDICKDLGGKYSFHGTSQRTMTTIKLAINFGTAFMKAVWYTSSLTLN